MLVLADQSTLTPRIETIMEIETLIRKAVNSEETITSMSLAESIMGQVEDNFWMALRTSYWEGLDSLIRGSVEDFHAHVDESCSQAQTDALFGNIESALKRTWASYN